MPWKRIEGVEVSLHAYLTSALDGGEWSASRPGRFTPGKGVTVTHWIRGWVGPRAGLGAVAKRKILVPTGNRTPIIQSLYWLSYLSREAIKCDILMTLCWFTWLTGLDSYHHLQR